MSSLLINSTIDFFERLEIKQGLKFLPLHKFIQDYLGPIFASITFLSCCNNNPKAWQFKSACKKILIHHELFEIHWAIA